MGPGQNPVIWQLTYAAALTSVRHRTENIVIADLQFCVIP